MASHVSVPDQDFQARVGRIDRLVSELDALPEPARTAAVEVVQAVLDLHGEALARLLQLVAEEGEQGDPLLAAFTSEPLVTHVLLLHGLHPVDLRSRVEGALESVRPYMRSHGGGVDLLAIDGDTVRLRLQGSCDGCPSSAMTMRLAVEKAILEAAPDVASIDVDGMVAPPAPPERALTPLPMAGSGNGAAAPSAAAEGWSRLDSVAGIGDGEVRRVVLEGRPLLVCRLDRTLYAYRARCPACEGTMMDAAVRDGALVCPHCLRGYEVRRAGRSAQTPYVLEPVPLLEEGTTVRLALAAATR